MSKKQTRADHILKHLSNDDRDLFLSELIEAMEQSQKEGNFNAINACVEDWEDTVELISIPGLKDSAWCQFNKLLESGLIN